MFKTADLYDEYLESLQVAAPLFRDFGGKTRFHGKVSLYMVVSGILPMWPKWLSV
ncbi:MAG: hypothetical protein R8K50_10990 [Mariprofundus sp.]